MAKFAEGAQQNILATIGCFCHLRRNNAGPIRTESGEHLARQAVRAVPAALGPSSASSEPKVENRRGMALDAVARIGVFWEA
jgi:hypothetical protein